MDIDANTQTGENIEEGTRFAHFHAVLDLDAKPQISRFLT
jgi:hypothetical protein